jgi:hypothetical protein
MPGQKERAHEGVGKQPEAIDLPVLIQELDHIPVQSDLAV